MDPFAVTCRYEPVPVGGAGLDRLLAALRATHANGGVLLARFRAVDVDGPWFATGAIVFEDRSFRELLASAALRGALPELEVPDPYPVAAPPRFQQSWAGTLSLDGELARVLVQGGAYVSFPGTAAEAKALAAAAAHDLVGDRHEDFRVYGSTDAWTPWFRDVAWDLTWFLVDDRDREVTVLCVTDND